MSRDSISNWHLPIGEVHVFLFPLAFHCGYKQLLDEHELVIRSGFRTTLQIEHYSAAHAVTRIVLGRTLRSNPKGVQIRKTVNGKPYCASNPDLKFNLSHTGDLAMLAVAWEADLGVDVELIRPMEDLESIARGFFADAECQAIMARNHHQERATAFFRCWTRKEAFVKATGEGLSTPLDSFSVSVDAGSARFVAGVKPSDWHIQDLSSVDNYFAAAGVASRPMTWQSFAVTDPAGEFF